MTRNLPAGGQPPPASTAAPARSKRAQRAPRPGSPQVRPRQAAQQTQSRPRQAQPQPWPCRAPRDGSAPDASAPPLRVTIGSPASLLAVVPGLLGFEPGNSIVVIGTEAPGSAVRVTLRYDVPDPRRTSAVAAIDAWADTVLAGGADSGPGGAAPQDAALIRDVADGLLGVAL